MEQPTTIVLLKWHSIKSTHNDIFFFYKSLLIYKSFHFHPSSQHPPSPSLRAVRASSPVGSSSSSPLPPGPGRWVSKQTGFQKSSICRGNKSQCHCQWLFRKTAYISLGWRIYTVCTYNLLIIMLIPNAECDQLISLFGYCGFHKKNIECRAFPDITQIVIYHHLLQ